MWLNENKVSDASLCAYRSSLLTSCPQHVVIDGLFNESKLDDVLRVLHHSANWLTQKHTYDALYVDNHQWEKTQAEQRFVKRDVWQRDAKSATVADHFLAFLRSAEFMHVLSRIFKVVLTDINVAQPHINTNFFRLSATDFIEQHADDSPGREICMLLYLNKAWQADTGGELVFTGKHSKPMNIAPLYNRCVLFDPSSKGSEHWVKRLNAKYTNVFRYNVTSWYWSE